MKVLPAPQPLFDTIDYLQDQELNQFIIQQNKLSSDEEQDYRVAKQFLKTYGDVPATFNSYRREIERFLHWSWRVAHKRLTQIKREDIEAFIYFCERPPKTWIGLKQVDRFIFQAGERIANPVWRPFVTRNSKKENKYGKSAEIDNYHLSRQGIQAIFSILSSFFTYLIQDAYLQINPVAQIRQKSKFVRKQQQKQPIRRLSELQWAYVIDGTKELILEDPIHERSLFILSALYGMYLRISELAISPYWVPQMGHFYQDHDGFWWFSTVGKGNKQRDISVSDDMLASLKRYRSYLGYTPLPTTGETTPLIANLSTGRAIQNTRQIRRIVQFCFDHAIEKLKKDQFFEEAEQLEAATVHWLRHTGISDDVKVRPKEHVRDDAGHSSSAITDRYIDIEKRARHQSKKNSKIMDL